MKCYVALRADKIREHDNIESWRLGEGTLVLIRSDAQDVILYPLDVIAEFWTETEVAS